MNSAAAYYLRAFFVANTVSLMPLKLKTFKEQGLRSFNPSIVYVPAVLPEVYE